MWHKKGVRYTMTETVPMTFSEPSNEIFIQAVQLTNPHLMVDTVKWEFIGTAHTSDVTELI